MSDDSAPLGEAFIVVQDRVSSSESGKVILEGLEMPEQRAANVLIAGGKLRATKKRSGLTEISLPRWR